MVETEDFHHPYFNLPVHSLYGETRTPTKKMLQGIDTLIIDLQDVGTRVYTYIQTLSHCLHACESSGVKVVILDRPNPIGGVSVQGNVLDKNFKSFVGTSRNSSATRNDHGRNGVMDKTKVSFKN